MGIEPPECEIPIVVPTFTLLEDFVPLLLSCVDLSSRDPTEREEVEREAIPGNNRGTFVTAPWTVFLSGILGNAARYFSSDLAFDLAFGFELGLGLDNFTVTFLIRECEDDEDDDDADEAGEGMVLGK